jgi:acyl carrier protein
VTTMNMPGSFRTALLAHLPYADSGELSETDDLAALGLDSMGVVQLLTHLEETFGLDLPDELITEETFETVGSLWAAVGGLLGPERFADV